MKAIAIIFVFMVSMFVSSCGQKETTTVNTTIKTTFSTEPTGSFLIAKKVVKKGDTVWAYSKDHYGTGLKWRDIVSQNPFLQEPGRVYFDTAIGEWIVVIKPGEELKIGNEVIVPVFVVEETTIKTTVTKEPASELFALPWLFWLAIGIFILALAWIIFSRTPFFSSSSAIAIANAGTHVDLRGTDNFDGATERAMRTRMIEREMYLKEDIWEDSRHILRLSADNNRLQNFTVSENEEGIFVNANFRRDRRERKNDRKNDVEK